MTLTFASWNQIVGWLLQLSAFRGVASPDGGNRRLTSRYTRHVGQDSESPYRVRRRGPYQRATRFKIQPVTSSRTVGAKVSSILAYSSGKPVTLVW